MALASQRREDDAAAELPPPREHIPVPEVEQRADSWAAGAAARGMRGLRRALGLSLTMAAYAASLTLGEAAEPKRQTLNIREHLSGNLYRGREVQVDTLVLHTTEGSGASAEGWLTNPKSNGSAHYLVMEDGSIVRLVREEDAAWHTKGYNKRGIGIEIAGFHDRPLPENEVKVAAELAYDIMVRRKIPLERVKPHMELAPGWHFDPGPDNWSRLIAAIRERARVDGEPAGKKVAPEAASKKLTAAEEAWLKGVFDRNFPAGFDRGVFLSRCGDTGVDPVLAVLQINQASGFRNAVSSGEARGYMQLRQATGEEELALGLWELMKDVRGEVASAATPSDKAAGLAARRTLAAIVPGATYQRIDSAVAAYWDFVKAWGDGGRDAEASASRFRAAVKPLYDPENVTQNLYLGVGYLAKMHGRFYEIPEASERWKFALAAYVGGRPNVNGALQSARDAEGVNIHTPGSWQRWDTAKDYFDDSRCNGGQIRDYVGKITVQYAQYRRTLDEAAR